MAKYLENHGLCVTIIKFSDLKKILEYCLNNNIPAIMNIHSFEADEADHLGHFVLFINYNDNSVIIRDPENEKRVAVSYSELEKKFAKTSDNDEIGGNIIILVTSARKNEKEYCCLNCNYVNKIDSSIEAAISGLVCIKCDIYIPTDK